MKVLQRIFNSLFLLVGLFLSFSACTDDNDVTATLLDKEYELVDIEWCRMPDDVSFSKAQSFTHESTSQQKSEGKHYIELDVMKGYRQSSLFLPDDPVLFQRLAGSVTDSVCVPQSATQPTTGVYFHMYTRNIPQVPFTTEYYLYNSEQPDLYIESETPFIAYITSEIMEYQVTYTYRALFRGKTTGQEIETIGKWEGIYYQNIGNQVHSFEGENITETAPAMP